MHCQLLSLVYDNLSAKRSAVRRDVMVHMDNSYASMADGVEPELASDPMATAKL